MCAFFIIIVGIVSYQISISYALFAHLAEGKETINLLVYNQINDIVITNIKIKSQENGGQSLNSSYTKTETTMEVELPNADSKVTYEVTLKSRGNITYELTDILETTYSNKNISYKI